MKRLAILALFTLPGILSCQKGVSVEEAVASITPEEFLRKIEIIAHDSMLGRDNPSPGLDMTAAWIADEFRRYGLRPGGDGGSFIQTYRMREIAGDFDGSWARVVGGADLSFGSDLSFMRPAGGGEVKAGVVVLAGDLMVARDFPTEQVRGMHVIVVPDAGSVAAPPRGRVRFPPGLMAAEPASVIFLDRSSHEDWAAAVERAREQRVVLGPWDDGSGFPMLNGRESSLAPVLASHGVDLARLPRGEVGQVVAQEVPGLEITLATAVREVGGFDLPNTVGILEGRDPVLKNEFILFSAHMDHVGVGRPNEAGDSIYNGADDNASGTIAVVELAEAFGMLRERPKRSFIFVAVSGEERGLWGSRFIAENPPVPLGQVVAGLNADMISRNAPDSVVVIGKDHSDLGETMNRVNAAHPELRMTAADDIWPEQNFYRRSDHFNFARRGVPVLFFFTGIHEDYHRPTDTVDRVNADKASRIIQLMFHLGMEVANAPDRPQWNPESYGEIVDMGGVGR
jgi:hypothetical protein